MPLFESNCAQKHTTCLVIYLTLNIDKLKYTSLLVSLEQKQGQASTLKPLYDQESKINKVRK